MRKDSIHSARVRADDSNEVPAPLGRAANPAMSEALPRAEERPALDTGRGPVADSLRKYVSQALLLLRRKRDRIVAQIDRLQSALEDIVRQRAAGHRARHQVSREQRVAARGRVVDEHFLGFLTGWIPAGVAEPVGLLPNDGVLVLPGLLGSGRADPLQPVIHALKSEASEKGLVEIARIHPGDQV